MRPIVYGLDADMAQTIDDFHVDWPRLVTVGKAATKDDFPYLNAIAQYTNYCIEPFGIFAHSFHFQDDPQFDRVLNLVHALPFVEQQFIPRLLARTNAMQALGEFAQDFGTLEEALQKVKFTCINPFLLTGMLADYLFRYGMYSYFYKEHTANDARDLALSLVEATLGSDLEQIIAFQAQGPWGAWFDPHSCTDRTFLLLQKVRRKFWLFCFSHSD